MAYMGMRSISEFLIVSQHPKVTDVPPARGHQVQGPRAGDAPNVLPSPDAIHLGASITEQRDHGAIWIHLVMNIATEHGHV